MNWTEVSNAMRKRDFENLSIAVNQLNEQKELANEIKPVFDQIIKKLKRSQKGLQLLNSMDKKFENLCETHLSDMILIEKFVNEWGHHDIDRGIDYNYTTFKQVFSESWNFAIRFKESLNVFSVKLKAAGFVEEAELLEPLCKQLWEK